MCVSVRIDAKNFNENVTQNVAGIWQNPTTGMIYVAWTGRDSAVAPGASSNKQVVFNTFNPVTKLAGTPVIVATTVTTQLYEGVSMVVLDDGRIILAAGVNSVETWESTDGGVNWTSGTADAGATRCLGGLISDGTHVWALTQETGGGGGQSDLYAVQRTAALTWAAPILINNTPGFSTSPFYEVFGEYRLSSMRSGGMLDDSTMFFLLGYSNASANEDQVRCIWTTNAWGTPNTTLVKDYTGIDATASFSRNPVTLRGNVGTTHYAMWVRNDPTYGQLPVLAQTADYGQTWTVPYSPTQFRTLPWDTSFNRAMALDPLDRMYVSVLDESDGANHKHRLFRSTTDPQVWIETVCEHMSINVSTASAGDGFIFDGDFYRVFDQVRGVGPSYFSVDVLYEEDVVPGVVPPPPLIEESPSGADVPNTYLRLRLGLRRGWSKHTISLTQMIHWPEGDWMSQRRVNRNIGVAGTIDPSVSEPADIPALYIMDHEGHLGRAIYARDAAGNQIQRLDPFEFEAETYDVPISKGMGLGVLRALMLEYRATASFRVEFKVDGYTVQTYDAPATHASVEVGPVGKLFVPALTDENTGSYARLRIYDVSLNDIILEKFAPIYIDKGNRG